MTFARRIFCAVLLAATGVVPEAFAQTEDYMEAVEPRRFALVVGNDAYEHHARLPGAKADADLVEQRLRGLGFEVVRAPPRATAIEFWTLDLDPFRERIKEGDVVLFYYSGHGFTYGGESFLAPLDAPAKAEPWRVSSLFIGEGGIRSMLQQKSPSFVGIILDACQSQAGFVDERDGQTVKGLGSRPPPDPASKDYWVAYAAQRGAPAIAGSGSAVSAFTLALGDHIAEPDVEILTLQKKVQYSLSRASGGNQVPYFVNSLVTNLWLNPTQAIKDEMQRQWATALKAGNRKAVMDYLAFYAAGPFAAAARRWLDENGLWEERNIKISPVSAEIGWLTSGKAALRVPRFSEAVIISATADLTAASSIAAVRSELAVDKTAFASAIYFHNTSSAPPDLIDGFDPTRLARPYVSPDASLPVANDRTKPVGLVNLGKPFLEQSLSSDGSELGTAVDAGEVAALVKAVREKGKKISWISIGTQRVFEQRTSAANGLLATDVQQRLVENGIPIDIITTAQNLPEVIDGVRVRIFVK